MLEYAKGVRSYEKTRQRANADGMNENRLLNEKTDCQYAETANIGLSCKKEKPLSVYKLADTSTTEPFRGKYALSVGKLETERRAEICHIAKT